MTPRASSPPGDESATAADWYVALDGGARDEITEARFASWLDRAADHEPALERCEAAVEIVRRLGDDPDLRFAFRETAALARGAAALRPGVPQTALLRAPKLAWGVAALAAIAVLAAVILQQARAPTSASPAADTPTDRAPGSRAAQIVELAPASDHPAIVLTGSVVVDANSVAVLPFVAQAAEQKEAVSRADIVADLHRDLVAALRAVPGLYVIAESSVLPYAALELPASEVGAQLGARAVLGADVAFTPGEVVITARLLDAATDTVLWDARYERPLADLRAVQVEILVAVAAALVDPELRTRSARGLAKAGPPRFLATIPAETASQ
jgi:TolB-like protein